MPRDVLWRRRHSARNPSPVTTMLDHVMFYLVMALFAAVLVIMGVWAWVETGGGDCGRRRRRRSPPDRHVGGS